MKVLLKRNWFSPQHARFRAEKGIPTEIPDRFKDVLPSDAVVVEEDYSPPTIIKGDIPETFSEAGKQELFAADTSRAEARAMDIAMKKAEEVKAKRSAGLVKARQVRAEMKIKEKIDE